MARCATLLIAACLATLLLVSPASAQAPWVRLPSDVDQVAVETYRPRELPAEYSRLSSFFIVSRRATVVYRLQIAAEFPLSYAEVSPFPTGPDRPAFHDDVTLGNPYLGVNWLANDVFELETGVRIPIVKHTAGMLVGARGTTTRAMAFTSGYVPVQIVAHVTPHLGRGFYLGLHGGPQVLIPSGSTSTRRTALRYSAQGWYETQRLAVGMGFHGRGPSGWSHQEVNVSLVGKIGRLRPGLIVRRILQDGTVSDGHTVLGVTLGLTPPSTEI